MAEYYSFCVVLFHYAVICSVFLYLTSNMGVHTLDIQCLVYEISSESEDSVWAVFILFGGVPGDFQMFSYFTLVSLESKEVVSFS